MGVSTVFVGLTGGIGAGKSTALQAFEQSGCAVTSADEIVHDLLNSEPVRDRLVERWGRGIAPHGQVDRDRVAEVVFGEQEELEWLEGVLFPSVASKLNQWRDSLEALDRSPAAAVVEMPLLFEAGVESMFDVTVSVVTTDSLSVKRAYGRGHALVAGRAARQLPQKEKARRSNHVITNDGTVDELNLQVQGLTGRILKDAQTR